jgi:uncharacterized small protein (DUF1192 family)
MFQLIATFAAAAAIWRLHARVAVLEELVDLLQSEIGRLDDELDCKMPR